MGKSALKDVRSVEEAVQVALASNDLRLAARNARTLANLRWGSRWYPRATRGSPRHFAIDASATLTVTKLRHDLEQFKYLQRRSVLGKEFSPIIRHYERLANAIASEGSRSVCFDPKQHGPIKHIYNRIVHVRSTPRVRSALSSAWEGVSVESQYRSHPSGLVVIDDFLSREALEELYLFCMESTIWSGIHYANGRLGAFFSDGFNCPLLIQIAEELRTRLPHLLSGGYPLQQLWGFKCEPDLPGDATNHADFAAVNVNFWLTPDEANLDRSSGGLVVYDVEAPLTWEFSTYNGREDIIKPFLQQQNSDRTVIPYRQNRAIIFNSDLFHSTDAVRFDPAYERRRINVTLLYGDRCDDTRYRRSAEPAGRGAKEPAASRSAVWRWGILSRTHGGV
jgi:hypothetical protein